MKKLIISACLILIPVFSYSQAKDNAGTPVKDIDGNVYKTIITDHGIWMAENLKVMKLNDGKPLTLINDKDSWRGTKLPAYGHYQPDVKYAQTYGAIYNWHAVSTGKLCPKGWHVPTTDEWNELMDYAGTKEKSGNNASRLKETGFTHWKAPNEGAMNDLHFMALPAGSITFSPFEEEAGTKTTWWTATEDKNNLAPGQKPGNAEIIGLGNDFPSKMSGTCQKESALPVRCKMDK